MRKAKPAGPDYAYTGVCHRPCSTTIRARKQKAPDAHAPGALILLGLRPVALAYGAGSSMSFSFALASTISRDQLVGWYSKKRQASMKSS